MKRGWMRSWRCASRVGLLSLLVMGASGQEPERRANELLLAGLRPGVGTLATAEKTYKAKHRKKDVSDGIAEWTDECTGRMLLLELNAKNVIQSVTISALGPLARGEQVDCHQSARDVLQTKLWRTGRGLKLGDPQHRVHEIYGEPNSSGPSTKGNRELELMFYAFDWAGSEVPQVMEVLCDRATGRVMEITLAFPSL